MKNNNLSDESIKKIIKLISVYKLKKILVAISGGQDSLYLIKIINQYKSYNNITIEYIYIDHQWKEYNKKNIIHLINYLTINKSQLSIYQIPYASLKENTARHYRYNILINHAIKNNYKCIITAHTKTDQIETFLMNLMKGTSIDGITSLMIHRIVYNNIHLLKPLINIKRLNINFFCRKSYLPIWSDSTNYNSYINRNRIRHELIPYLNTYMNFNLENNISKFIYIADRDNEYIKQNTLKLYINIKNHHYIAINYKVLQYQHYCLKSRILQLFFLYNFNILINYININKLIKIFNQKNIMTIKLNYLIIKKSNRWLYII